MRAMTVILTSAVLAAVALPSHSVAQAPPAEQEARQKINMVEALNTHSVCVFGVMGAKIDPDDEVALVMAVRNESQDKYLANFAACVLRFHQPSDLIDSALLDATRSPEEYLMDNAVESLIAHKNFAWVDEAARRFPGLQERAIQISMAGNLATAGRYQGWPLIRSLVTRKGEDKRYVEQALWQVQKFVGVKDDFGQPLDLNKELGEMFSAAPIENRKGIIDAMVRIAPRRPKNPPRTPGKK